MESQEKSFRDLLQDERVKKLERHMKLTQIKKPNSLQLTSSPHMSISGISSIHGDNPLSDLSFCTPSVTSTRSGSVILASSNNFRKQLSKNLKMNMEKVPVTSSVFEGSLDSRNTDEDRMMMPPPPSLNSHKSQFSVNTVQKVKAANSTAKPLLPQGHDDQNCSSHSLHEASHSDTNVAVGDEAVRQVSRNGDTSKQHGRVFKNWTVRLNDHGQIIIKGRLESGELARSKAVKKRVSANRVISVLKHQYHLVGDIHDVREELPEYVRGKFYNGFPTDWENVHQIWQSYVNSGFSLQFRWPRPIADSDDDLVSDITDLTVANLRKSKTKPTSFVSTPRPCSQTTREIDKSVEQKESRSKHKEEINDSDISSIHSMETENPASRAKTSALETSSKNTAEQKSEARQNHLGNDSPNRGESASRTVLPNNTESSIHGNIVPRWKVDIIIDNLMNKNCSKEYIDKVIMAIDCFNELLAMPCTNNNSGIGPDEGVSLNYNSNGQADTTNNKSCSQTAKNVNDSRVRCGKEATACASNSYSLENSQESEEESPNKQIVFFREPQPVPLRKNTPAGHTSTELHNSRNSAFESKNLQNYSDKVDREPNGSTSVRSVSKSDTRQLKNQVNQDTAILSKEQIVETSNEMKRHKRKPIFDTDDSETESRQSSSRARTASVNDLSILPTSKVQKNQPVTSEKANEKVAQDGNCNAFYDSDVSILDTHAIPARKPKVLSVEKVTNDLGKLHYQRETLPSNFSFADTDRHNRSRTSSPVPSRSEELSNAKLPCPPQAPVVDKCTVRLSKIPEDEYNRCKSNPTPSKSEKTSTGHRKNKNDAIRRTIELPGSDSENLSMRMSSRGRRIVPPLDYWNGERVQLKGRELVYSPGACRTASLSANSILLQQSLMSPNNTAASEPALTAIFAKNLNKTPTCTIDCSQPGVESSKKSVRRVGGILSEISGNHDENVDNALTSGRRRTRTSKQQTKTDVKKNRKTRTVIENDDSSSGEEKVNPAYNRKRRRIH